VVIASPAVAFAAWLAFMFTYLRWRRMRHSDDL
jgi:hypothetical protein